MMSSLLDRVAMVYQQFLVQLVDLCRRVAIWVVIGLLIVTGLLLVYTVNNLTLDTNPLNLLDPDLPFRHLDQEFVSAFPELDNLIVVVIDQGTTDGVRDAVRQLAADLKGQPALFSSVYDPAQGDFFDTYGLLYLNTDELWNLDERLSKWEPFLGTLVHDPSLRGLFSMLTLALDEQPNADEQVLLGKVFNLLSESIEAQIAGTPNSSSWKEAMLDDVTKHGDPKRGFLLTKPRLDYSTMEGAGEPMEFIRQQSKGLEETFKVRVRMTGSIPIETEERETLSQGASLAAMMSISMVCIILFLGLRSVRLVGAMLATLIVGLIWTGAFAVFAIGSLNFISAAAPVLFIGLGIDFGIQFGMRYREAFDRLGAHDVALRQAAGGVGGALTLSAIAAALSFFSFLPTAYRGFAELGLIAGGGMFLALFANLTFFPALLTVLPIPRSQSQKSRDQSEKEVRTQVPFVLRYRRPILFLMAPITLAAVAALPLLRFDFNPLHLRDPTTEGVSTFQELLEDPDTSPYVIQVVAQNLAEANELAARLKQLDVVDRALTLSKFVPDDQEEKLTIIDDMALVLDPVLTPVDPLPPPNHAEEVQVVQDFKQQLVDQATPIWGQDFVASVETLATSLDRFGTSSGWAPDALQELRTRLIGNFPTWLDRLRKLMNASPVTLESLPQQLKDHYIAKDGRARIEIFPVFNGNDNEKLRQFTQGVQQIAPRAIGSPVGIVEGGQAIIDACLQATTVAILASTVLLFIVFRRPGEVLLVLLPLVMTMVLTVAASLLLDVPLNLANVVALPLVLGLGIAFGIYLVLRKREGFSMAQVLHSSTSKAVLFSALTTMASFGALGFSRHQGMASLGMLLALTLSLALLCALVVLPALIGELEARGWWKDT
ncbi:MAG: MMPL family transporter [Nitrospinae bacterium]|nr:MMPL family transporter [Nitrospinota bacterium]